MNHPGPLSNDVCVVVPDLAGRYIGSAHLAQNRWAAVAVPRKELQSITAASDGAGQMCKPV